MNPFVRSLCAFACVLGVSSQASAINIAVTEDVMTSSFFQGTDQVRGYPGDISRAIFRVSTENPFGTTGAETIYLTFGYDFSTFAGPVSAILTLQSVAGGFGADASAASPFTVSAHAVTADPLTSITDNTNPGGPISALTFYSDNIRDADAAARTVVNGFGAVSFDVSAIVNGWITGTNTIQAIALTGKNDLSGNEFLHGFRNNTEAPGSTFLTVTPVPEPETYALLLAGLGVVAWGVRRGRSSCGENAVKGVA